MASPPPPSPKKLTGFKGEDALVQGAFVDCRFKQGACKKLPPSELVPFPVVANRQSLEKAALSAIQDNPKMLKFAVNVYNLVGTTMCINDSQWKKVLEAVAIDQGMVRRASHAKSWSGTEILKINSFFTGIRLSILHKTISKEFCEEVGSTPEALKKEAIGDDPKKKHSS